MLKIIGIIFLLLLVPVIIFLSYIGIFSSVKVSLDDDGGYYLVCQKVQGDYKQTGKLIDNMHKWLLAKNISTYKGFGIYYDNPQKVSADKLRSVVGCILENKDADKIGLIEKKYFVKTLPLAKYAKAVFPYKNRASIFAGIFKVYPAIEKFIAKNDYPYNAVIEIYDMPGKKINYLVPVDANTDFVKEYYEYKKI